MFVGLLRVQSFLCEFGTDRNANVELRWYKSQKEISQSEIWSELHSRVVEKTIIFPQ